jgi:hypothetical protein
MFERHHQPLLPRRQFAARVARSVGIAVGIDAAALLVGGVGLRCLEGLDWTDALLNAGLVLTGNGPVVRMQSDGGKVFLLLYAVLGVVVFAAVISVVMAPLLHRTLHAFHGDVPDEERRP